MDLIGYSSPDESIDLLLSSGLLQQLHQRCNFDTMGNANWNGNPHRESGWIELCGDVCQRTAAGM